MKLLPANLVEGFMTRQERREQAIQEYAQWLGKYGWTWYGTLNIRSGTPSDSFAKELLHDWLSEIKRLEGGPQFRYFAVMERGSITRHRHYHVLVGGLRNRRKEAISRWNFLGGDAVIQSYDPAKNGILYALKTMDDSGNLASDFDLPKWGPEFSAAPEGVFPAEPETQTTTSLRVSNLSEKISPHDLRELFAPCGQIFGLQMHSCPEQTFAVLDMRQEDAQEAVDYWHGRRWRGLRLRVEDTRH
jgi:hypothetical protein